MTEYKLVPVEPTPEMLAAGEYALEVGCYASGIYADMLAAAPDVQSTFTVGTDLSDGELTVVVMKHENDITWVIHSEVIQLAEQQPALTKYQPCGCVLCTCEHETQCQGCGAKHCGTHPVGHIPDAEKTTSDKSLDRQIGGIGDQIHNLGCRYQNDEELSEHLSSLACSLWEVAKKVYLMAPAPITDVSKQQPDVSAPVETINRAIDALERFANDSLAGRNSAHELRELLAAAPDVQGEPMGWYTEDHLDDKSATTYNAEVAQRWRAKGWPVTPLYTAPQPVELKPDATQLVELLSHARCNTCDGSGGFYDNHGHPHQCQWCHDRSKALAARRKQGDQP